MAMNAMHFEKKQKDNERLEELKVRTKNCC